MCDLMIRSSEALVTDDQIGEKVFLLSVSHHHRSLPPLPFSITIHIIHSPKNSPAALLFDSFSSFSSFLYLDFFNLRIYYTFSPCTQSCQPRETYPPAH